MLNHGPCHMVGKGYTAAPFDLNADEQAETSAKPRPQRAKSGLAGKQEVLKTLTYAVMHFCVAVVVAFALTGDVAIALSIGLVEPLVQTVAYALHERGWKQVSEKMGETVAAPLKQMPHTKDA